MSRAGRGLLIMVAGVGALLPISGVAEQATSAGSVFVMTNAADKNEIIRYSRDTNGGLFETNRFATEGKGSGGVNDPLEAQGSLTLSPDGSLLFAVNAGSGTVSVLGVKRSSLEFIDKAPTGGSEPVAVAVNQQQSLVYVLNAGGSGSVVGFRVGADGHLKQIKDSTAFLTANVTGGASVTISSNGKFLAVTERLANNVDTFRINSDGTLGPIVVNPSAGPGAFSARFAPDGNLLVSETGPATGTNVSAISSYKVSADGKLTAVSQSVATFGSANCWNVITPDGKHVYVSNAASSTISGFSIGANGALTPIASTVVGTNPQGSGNLDIAVSSDGKYIYTLNSAAGTVGIFSIQPDGTLTNVGEANGLEQNSGFNGIAAN
jgi:6-phosphogluconolactonase